MGGQISHPHPSKTAEPVWMAISGCATFGGNRFGRFELICACVKKTRFRVDFLSIYLPVFRRGYRSVCGRF